MSGEALILYHGTDAASAVDLLNGQPLDPAIASAKKRDGPPGFFLATHAHDAEFFAMRRGHRRATLVRVTMSSLALERLSGAGCALRPISHTAGSPGFSGSELRIAPEHFPLFNGLRLSGDVVLDQE
jgi:hypothetical protein